MSEKIFIQDVVVVSLLFCQNSFFFVCNTCLYRNFMPNQMTNIALCPFFIYKLLHLSAKKEKIGQSVNAVISCN